MCDVLIAAEGLF